MLSILGKNFSRQHFEIFFLFFPENRLCLFSGKNKKNTINLLSAEFIQRVVKVKPYAKRCLMRTFSVYKYILQCPKISINGQ